MSKSYDKELQVIADYVLNYKIKSKKAFLLATICLKDALGCAMLALRSPECIKLLGPIMPGTIAPGGTRIPGTQFILDPVQSAFNIGAMIRWVDFNDAWFGKEWAHPSDNIGGILAAADYISQKRRSLGEKPLLMKDVLTAIVKAHEIQGLLSIDNSLNRLGFDHVGFVKLASTAVVTQLLGGKKEDILAAISQTFIDGQSLRTYRHFPNTGPRKSWASADATSRAVWLATMTLRGEMGYPSVLSTKTWGFYDAVFKGNKLNISQKLGNYVIENIIFKASFPAEIHAQTAVEAALELHHQFMNKKNNKDKKNKTDNTHKIDIDKIEKITLETQESAVRIISKKGPLKNYADRDHCIEYMIAVALIYGKLTPESYDDDFAKDKRIDALREKIETKENKQYSKDYLDPKKRSVANALQIFFKDGTKTDKVVVEYPLGHPKRRKEGKKALQKKFEVNLATHFPKRKIDNILEIFQNQKRFEDLEVDVFMEKWIQ